MKQDSQPFPWPPFRMALPILWGGLALLLLLNPGDEYGELVVGTLPALVLATGAAWWAGRVLDRLVASPRIFAAIWSLAFLLLLVLAGLRHAQFARHLREGKTALVSVPLAAAEAGLTTAIVIALPVAIVRALRRERDGLPGRRPRLVRDEGRS